MSKFIFYGKKQFFVFSAGFNNVAKGFELTSESFFDGVFFASGDFIMVNM